MAKRYLGWVPRLLSDEKTVLGIRYAYVVLAAISVLAASIAVFVGIEGRTANNHKFCEVIDPAIAAFQANVPTNPAALNNPKVRENLAWIIRFEHLGKGLGC